MLKSEMLFSFCYSYAVDTFIWRVVLSFIVGGLFTATIIWISEKYGSKVGGILTGVPTTVLVGLTFISLTAGNEAAHKAALIIPAMVGVSLILVYSFTRLLNLGPEFAMTIAIIIWLIFALFFVNLNLTHLLVNVLIGTTLMGIAKFAMKDYPHNLKAGTKVLRRTYAVRIIGAGSVIAGAVVIARIAGPVWGGVFTAFPATFVTTLYILSNAQGSVFTKAVARQLPLANGSTLTFAVIFYLLIIPAGLCLSVLAGIMGSLLYSTLLIKLSD